MPDDGSDHTRTGSLTTSVGRELADKSQGELAMNSDASTQYSVMPVLLSLMMFTISNAAFAETITGREIDLESTIVTRSDQAIRLNSGVKQEVVAQQSANCSDLCDAHASTCRNNCYYAHTTCMTLAGGNEGNEARCKEQLGSCVDSCESGRSSCFARCN